MMLPATDWIAPTNSGGLVKGTETKVSELPKQEGRQKTNWVAHDRCLSNSRHREAGRKRDGQNE